MSAAAPCMQDKRLAILNTFFSTNDKATLESLLSDQAQVTEQGSQSRTYNKSEFVNLLCNHVVPAIPDFNWGHSTDGAADKEGYALVTCQVNLAASRTPLARIGQDAVQTASKNCLQADHEMKCRHCVLQCCRLLASTLESP